MAKFILPAVIASVLAMPAFADDTEIAYDNFQTIYTETPVQSYYAYPDDPNFIPETEFMERADSLDYDQTSLMPAPPKSRRTPVSCLPTVQ